MKTRLQFITLSIFVILLSVASCKKDVVTSIPIVTTAELTNITDTSATTGGSITNGGGLTTTEKGVCWSISENPSISDNKIVATSTTSSFECSINGLKGGVTYYVRAFATNSLGTGYGQQVILNTIVKSEAISYSAGYANDIYYSLKNGVIATPTRASWDIAFSVSTRSSSILINEGSGVTLKVYGKAWAWANAIDTAGYYSWPKLQNSDTDWEVGAFNANQTGHPNYGWGIYNSVNHNIENADGGVLYLVKLRNGSFKKIWIETKFSGLQKYSFRFADMLGNNTNEQIVSNMDVSTSKANYVYYSLQDNTKLDREPDAATWDLVFTKWVDNGINYTVTGVLQNIGVKAIDLTVGNPPVITYTDGDFISDINTIGYDWKSFNGTSYDVPTNRVFIVKDNLSRVYQINFASFAGSSTGNFTFNIKQL
jgi:hypothetical protein